MGFFSQLFNVYDERGFRRDGRHKNGTMYDDDGYDKNGYNSSGFDANGFDRKGYDKNGFNRLGWDEEGYNADGFNRKGYDRNGFNKDGYDKKGFDRYGFNASGFDCYGYNRFGFDKAGYNREGFDTFGLNKFGFDKDGYNRLGYNQYGYNREGYDRFGFDKVGYNKMGFDKLGYDKDGFDKDGYNRSGCNREGLDRMGRSKLFLMTEKAYVNKDKQSLFELGVTLRSGSCGVVNTELVQRLYDVTGKKARSDSQHYLTPTKTAFASKNDSSDERWNEEQIHLNDTKKRIDEDIMLARNSKWEIDDETWWMDKDQRQHWATAKMSNLETERKISVYETIRRRPYYARMDYLSKGIRNTAYIGEEPYVSENQEIKIASVWSEIGKRYREKRLTSFTHNNRLCEVQLRRNIDITNGTLMDIFDEYDVSSNASEKNITDLYLLKVLEEKKDEDGITNIIRSIQLNQNAIIEYDFNKNLVVQGCAGSGKTMILLHRLANMKFNNPNYDYNKVKIITPNQNFTTFIDDLTKNLHIEQIPKLTLAEYWADIIYRYRIQSGGTKEYITQIDVDDTPLEYRKVIYSPEFALILKQNIEALPIDAKGLKYQKEITVTDTDDYGRELRDAKGKKKTKKKDGALTHINNAIQKTLDFYKIDLDVFEKMNIECVLYARVLGAYYYYEQKALRDGDRLLCIDEGQDISLLQYNLMLKINGNVKLNVYGDLNQQLPSGCNINDWQLLARHIEAHLFVLNENYRNSEQIINFYNSELQMDNLSFGVKTREVETILGKHFSWQVLVHLILGKRTAIICNDPQNIPKELQPHCAYNDLSSSHKVVVLTVKQAKGLEYDTIFVCDKNLSRNEKYVAYTRALSELYIVE